MELYGSIENLKAVRHLKEQDREMKVEKRFEKKIHKMRKEVNSFLQQKLKNNTGFSSTGWLNFFRDRVFIHATM